MEESSQKAKNTPTKKHLPFLIFFITLFLQTTSAYSIILDSHEYSAKEIGSLSAPESEIGLKVPESEATKLTLILSKIPTDHPRIFINKAELEALRARVGLGAAIDYNLDTLTWREDNITFGEMSSQYNILKNLVDNHANDPEGFWKVVDNNSDVKDIAWAAIPYAFVNMVEPNQALVTSATYLLDKCIDNEQISHGSDGGSQVWPFAIAYDWLSDHLTDTEKIRYASYMIKQVNLFGFAGGSGGHFPKTSCLSNLNAATGLRALFVGFALFNDLIALNELNVDNRVAEQIIDDYGGFLKRVVDGLKMAGAQGGGYFEDFGHATMSLDNLIYLLELWHRGTGEDLFVDFQTMKYRPLLNMQVAKPNGNATFSNAVKFNRYRVKSLYQLLARQYSDSTIQSIAHQHFRILNNTYLWKEILWHDTSLQNDLVLDDYLPKVHLFNPTGWLFIRDGFELGSTTRPSANFWASIFAGRFFPAHKWYKMNSFAIFFKGNLLVNNSLDAPPLQPTEYHNTIWLDSENQIERGDQDEIVGWKNFEKGTNADLTEIDRFITSDQFTYARSIAHKLYDTTKLDYWTREHVHIPATTITNYFAIYDRITTDSDMSTTKNMLNSFYTPVINDSNPALILIDAGGNASDNLDGRVYTHIIFPENMSVDIKAITANATLKEDKSALPRWTMIISPENQNKNDIFLNILEVTDSSRNSSSNIIPITPNSNHKLQGEMAGAHIQDVNENKILLFGTDPAGHDVIGNMSYTIHSTTVTSGHFLFGLRPDTTYNLAVDTTPSGDLNFNYSSPGQHKVSAQGTLALFYDSDSQTITTTSTSSTVIIPEGNTDSPTPTLDHGKYDIISTQPLIK